MKFKKNIVEILNEVAIEISAFFKINKTINEEKKNCMARRVVGFIPNLSSIRNIRQSKKDKSDNVYKKILLTKKHVYNIKKQNSDAPPLQGTGV